MELRLRGLGKDYGARRVVGAIDLDVGAGECVGLLGPNGAGKTTTTSMIAGILAPSRGTVEVCGHDMRRAPRSAKARLGVVPQELALYEELTAIENLSYFGALYGLHGKALVARTEAVLTTTGLGDRAREPVKRFSGGMKRRLNLAVGLLHEPAVLVLDEPTVGVDPQSRTHIFATVRALRAAGTAIVYTSHYMEEVEALCDRVAIVDGGAVIAQGTVREVVANHGAPAIEIVLSGDQAAISASVAAAADHGTVERNEGNALWIVPAAGVAPLVSAIEATGVTIVKLSLGTAGLEAAFLALTGRALRDDE